MLNRAARDHVNHILIGVRSTQYRQNSSQMSSYAATIPLIGIGTENSATDPGLRFINDSLFM